MVRLPLIGLVAFAALFGQHPLPYGSIFWNPGHTGFKAITGGAGCGSASTLSRGIACDGLAKGFVPLTAFFSNHTSAGCAAGRNPSQAGLEGIVRLCSGFR
jgi:hypothetical protein